MTLLYDIPRPAIVRRNELRAWHSGLKTDQKLISKTIIISALEDRGRGGGGMMLRILCAATLLCELRISKTFSMSLKFVNLKLKLYFSLILVF